MAKEEMLKLLEDAKDDLTKIEQAMKRQVLAGGLRPEHVFQYTDIKINLCITLCLKILEELTGVSIKQEEVKG